jgi:hypothetical protein
VEETVQYIIFLAAKHSDATPFAEFRDRIVALGSGGCHNHPVDPLRAAGFGASARTSATIGANIYRKEHSEGSHADGWAMGPREVELAACGSFFLREPRPEGDKLFPMLPTFTEPGELGDLIRWWLPQEDRRRDAAVAAQAAIADRTFTNTAASLLRFVDGVGKVNAA